MRKASEEKCLIETERYRGNDNLPTCSRDYANNKVCEFLMTKQMGVKFVCFYDMDKNCTGAPKMVREPILSQTLRVADCGREVT